MAAVDEPRDRNALRQVLTRFGSGHKLRDLITIGGDGMTVEWTAHMITGAHGSAPILRRTVVLDAEHGPVVSARLRTTALGLLEARINGIPVSDDVLAPGWSTYEKRLRVADWDVTSIIGPSTTIVLVVGNGWYRGRLGWSGLEGVYGQERAASAEFTVTFQDGYQQVVVTDERWTTAASGILSDDLYDGQVTDATGLLARSAHTAGDALFGPVRIVDFDPAILEEYIGPPVRRQEERRATVLGRTSNGDLLLDFGQNLVGWLRITMTGARGAELIAQHAEVLEHGDLALRPLRSAKATDRFIYSGGPDEFEPTFTLHGFRYARISGWTGTDAKVVEAIRAVVVGSEMERTGTFDCSDPDLVRLHENVVWGMRGNFVDVPTDCPQRDERMGYVGDLAAFAPTAAYLYDINAFLRDWLRNLTLEQQLAAGQVPLTVPNVLKYETQMNLSPELLEGAGAAFEPGPMALWQDGAVWIPWSLYEAYGDVRVLEEQRESIDAYLSFVEGALDEDGTLTAGFQLGDWLDPASPPDNPREARADREVVATACMYRTVDLGSRIARLAGDEELAAHREALAHRIRSGFLAKYVHNDGRIRSDAPTVYALAIVFGLVTGPAAEAAGGRLAQLIADGGHVIATGFIGTPFVLHALSSTGHTDTAYRLIQQRSYPSWLYQIDMGATTIWERWDSLLPDGTVNPGEMTSFNHYAFGSVADWLHRVVAGISPLEPGYRRVLIAPQPGGTLHSAGATLRTRFGVAGVQWSSDGTRITLRIQVAPETEAVLRLSGREDRVLGPGVHEIVEPDRPAHGSANSSRRRLVLGEQHAEITDRTR